MHAILQITLSNDYDSNLGAFGKLFLYMAMVFCKADQNQKRMLRRNSGLIIVSITNYKEFWHKKLLEPKL